MARRLVGLLVLFALIPSAARAKCGEGTTFAATPFGTIGALGPILLESGIDGQLEELDQRGAWLESSQGKVPLRLVALHPSSFNLTQAVLVPTRELEVGSRWALRWVHPVADAAFVVEARSGLDRDPWAGFVPTVEPGVRAELGCGPEENLTVHVPTGAAFFEVALEEEEAGGARLVWLVPANGRTLALGHSMCSGAFELEPGQRYRAQLTAIDGAGRRWPGPPMVLEGPKGDAAWWRAPSGGGALEVTLLDLEGRPMLGSRARARSASDSRYAFAPYGRARLVGLPAGEYAVDLFPWPRGRLSLPTTVAVETNARARVTITQVKPGQLTGRLLDEDGRPLSGWNVGVEGAATRTNELGEYRIEGAVPFPEQDIGATCDEHALRPSEPFFVRGRAKLGEPTELRGPRQGRVTILIQTAGPMPERVELHTHPQLAMDRRIVSDGRVVLETCGEVHARLEIQGLSRTSLDRPSVSSDLPATLDIDAPEGTELERTVVLTRSPPPPPGFHGRVVSGAGQPVVNALVAAVEVGSDEGPPSEVRTGPDGSFELHRRDREHRWLRVSADGLAGRFVDADRALEGPVVLAPSKPRTLRVPCAEGLTAYTVSGPAEGQWIELARGVLRGGAATVNGLGEGAHVRLELHGWRRPFARELDVDGEELPVSCAPLEPHDLTRSP